MGCMDAAGDVETTRELRTAPHLRAEFERSALPRHLALFYRSPETQLTAAATYVGYGLRNDRRCLYLADDNTPAQIESAFDAAGIDVAARTAADDLRIRDASEVYLDAGFDPDRLISTLKDACTAAVDDDYDGLLVAGENTWSFHTDTSFDHVLDFEAEFDADSPDMPVTALCQYDLSRFCESSVAKAIRTHERIIYRNTLCENPYYLPPSEYRETENSELNVRLMLEQTHDLARSRQQVERREQRLAVVNRVLRHNVRNEMNVIRGYLDRLRSDASLRPAAETWVETAISHLDDMVEMSDKARYVQDSLGSGSAEHLDLGSVLGRAVGQARRDYPEATIEIHGDADVSVLADTNLDAALTELVTNAAGARSEDRPAVTVLVDNADVESVRIEVGVPGWGIPETDRRALQEGEETKLEHADGLGLWFVKWIVESTQGTMTLPDDGADVRIDLPRAQ